jgi:hypothetical protein
MKRPSRRVGGRGALTAFRGKFIAAWVIGYFGLGDPKSRSTLDEGALIGGRHIFGWHLPFHVAQIRDAREER